MIAHDAKCPARTGKPDDCDCGALCDPSMGRKMDGFGNGCAVALGRTTGSLTGWAIFIWLFRHDIATWFAWVALHFRIVP